MCRALALTSAGAFVEHLRPVQYNGLPFYKATVLEHELNYFHNLRKLCTSLELLALQAMIVTDGRTT